MNREGRIGHFIKSRKLRDKIILFYLVLAFLTVIVNAVFYYQMSNRYIDETVYDLSVSEIQSHNRGLELLIEDINTYSKEIISSPSIQTALDPNQDQLYQLRQVDQELAASMMFDEKISSIYVFDFQGKKYYRDKEVFKNLQLEDIMDMDWYQDLVDARGGYILNFNGDGLIDDEENNYLSFLRIINNNVDHQPVGLMMINVEASTIMDVFNVEEANYRALAFRESVYGTDIVLWNDENRSPNEDELRTISSAFERLDSEKLFLQDVAINKQTIGVTAMFNEDLRLSIVEVRAGRDRQALFGDFNFIIMIIIAMNGILIIIGSIWFSNYMTNPITELTESMKGVKDGSFELVKGQVYHDEIGKLKEGYNFMIVEIQRLITEKIKEQEEIKDAELRVIMEQIKPHFMYNTLDSINSLVMLGLNEDAEKALTALSKFYRSSLSDGRSIVTLETELNIIKNYLLIQNIRHKGLLKWNTILMRTSWGLKFLS